LKQANHVQFEGAKVTEKSLRAKGRINLARDDRELFLAVENQPVKKKVKIKGKFFAVFSQK
jgi:hypothetical protein